MGMRFQDRDQAGRQLAGLLSRFRGRPDTLILGLARGGVPVAAALASELGLPAGVLPVRKLGIPGHTEIAFGALAWSGGQGGGQSGGQVVRILNRSLLTRLLALGLTQSSFDEVELRERAELERRAARYPDSTRNLGGKTVILADDGLATGASMRAAVEAVRGAGAARVVVAVPVASLTAQASLEPVTEAVFSLHTPGQFRAVGSYYQVFEQLEDDDVVRLLPDAPG
jgi:putative phosphoribosyl transferase